MEATASNHLHLKAVQFIDYLIVFERPWSASVLRVQKADLLAWNGDGLPPTAWVTPLVPSVKPNAGVGPPGGPPPIPPLPGVPVHPVAPAAAPVQSRKDRLLANRTDVLDSQGQQRTGALKLSAENITLLDQTGYHQKSRKRVHDKLVDAAAGGPDGLFQGRVPPNKRFDTWVPWQTVAAAYPGLN